MQYQYFHPGINKPGNKVEFILEHEIYNILMLFRKEEWLRCHTGWVNEEE
jgi:hypothetical protein